MTTTDAVGYDGTRTILTTLGGAAATMLAHVSLIIDQLGAADLDPITLEDLAGILDAAEAARAATAAALNGLTTRHGAIAEAITTSPLAEASAGARRTGTAPSTAVPSLVNSRVSFAGLDRDARLKAMHAEIDEAVTRMADPAGWKAFLDAVASFHTYSFNNTILLSLQRPEAQPPFAGFKSWRSKHDRTVRKGEKANWIYAPITRTVAEADPATGEVVKARRVIGFHPVPVYSIDQTDGKPLPTRPHSQYTPLDGEAPDGLLAHLARQVTNRGYTVYYRENLGRRDGYTDFADKTVVIDATASGQHQALVLAHELAHIVLGHQAQTSDYHTGRGGRRSEMEIEAESVAYILARHHGLTQPGQASFGYIADWARDDADKVRTTADRVLTAVRELTSDLIGDQK